MSGHAIATTDGSGNKQGATRSYDPYGTPLTTNPDNQAGNFDFGWHGGTAKMTETEAGLNIIEMSARQYVPGLGRFIETNPVDGGSANNYEYSYGDPVNLADTTGRCPFCAVGLAIGARAAVPAIGLGAKWALKQTAKNAGKAFSKKTKGQT